MNVRVALVAAVCLSDCLDPTEIVVVVSTDVPCSSVNSVAIAVGKPDDDSNSTSAKTTSCSSDGGVGTLVVTPSGGIDDDVGIRVTLGVGSTAADQCVAPSFQGCITARRSLTYYPHHPLTLPIDMDQVCENVACDANTTCVNGSCVDAGIPCDKTGTCTIDAGPPPPPIDAGTCDIAPKLVTPAATRVTPHIVQTHSGYAIGWETTASSDPTRAYDVIALDASGNPGKTIEFANGIAPGTSVGALGTDGTNFAATYQPSTSAYMTRIVDPNELILKELQMQMVVQLPNQGMRYDNTLGAYVFFLVFGSNASVEVFPTGSAGPTTTGVNVPSALDPALAYGNATYYGSVHDQSSCYLVIGSLTTTAMSAVLNNVWPNCSTLRVAENAKGVDLVATRETDGGATGFSLHLRNALAPTSAALIADSVDDQAIVALPGVGTTFHVIYSASQMVRDTIVDVAAKTFTPAKTIGNTGVGGGTAAIGFDAVAEAGTMIHDVAFWSLTPTPGIYFTRICE